MNVSPYFKRRNLLIGAAILLPLIMVAAYFALRRPPRVAMARYAPAEALAYIEIDNLTDILDGLTNTNAWRELAPALGVSSQLRDIGFAADVMSRTGLGPEEVVVAGRAQYAIALTGIEAETGAEEDGPYLRFKPRVALLAETHASAATAERLVRERASLIAQRIYNGSFGEESEDYFGARIIIYKGPQPGREFIAASLGSLIVFANHITALRSCLDTIGGRAAALDEDATLKQLRPAVDQDAAVFAFVTEKGFEKLAELSPAIVASRFTTDPDRIGLLSNLFGRLSQQTTAGLLYGSGFADGKVTERYLTVLRPPVAVAIADTLKAAPAALSESLKFVPHDVEDFMLVSVERAGELPERMLKGLSPNLDLVAGLALREFVLTFREQLGLESHDAIGDALGNEILLVRTNDSEPMVMILRARDKARLAPFVERYLKKGNQTVAVEWRDRIEIAVSSHPDQRAAAFANGFLLLGTREQLKRFLDAQASGDHLAKEERLQQALTNGQANAALLTCRLDVSEASRLLLAVSRLTRTTDGSPELLEQSPVRQALAVLPPAISITQFRDYGVYTETTSAFGNFSLLASFFDGSEAMTAGSE